MCLEELSVKHDPLFPTTIPVYLCKISGVILANAWCGRTENYVKWKSGFGSDNLPSDWEAWEQVTWSIFKSLQYFLSNVFLTSLKCPGYCINKRRCQWSPCLCEFTWILYYLKLISIKENDTSFFWSRFLCKQKWLVGSFFFTSLMLF